MKVFSVLAFALLLVGCGNPPDQESTESTQSVSEKPLWKEPALPMIAEMEKAHRVEAFREKEAIAFDLELHFGGKLRLEARITATTESDRVRVDRKDGTALLFYRGEGYKTPAGAEWPRARFDLLTWQYFAMAPFKFSDPGTHWETLPEAQVEGVSHPRGKLTFGEQVGDAPDDWYIVYQDPKTHLLEGMAYIVTFSRSQEEAEKNPHAIRYSDYREVDGIPFATRWTFWNWSEAEGFEGPAIGEATLENIEFIDPEPDFFQPVEDSQPIPREQI